MEIIPQLSDAPVVLDVPARLKEMISVSRVGNRIKIRINFSSMDTIQNCLRKAKHSLFDGWKPIDEAVATVFGSAFHKALEVLYKGSIEERKLPTLEAMQMMAFGNFVEGEKSDLLLRSTRAFVEAAQPLKDIPETDKHSIVNGCWILFRYFETYLTDPYVAYVDKDGPFVERTFSLVVHEDETIVVELFGTIDVVLRHVTTGELLPCDHKTVGFLNFGGSSFFDRERPNHQYCGYLLGAREVFGIETNKFMVNCVEKKAKPKTKGAIGVQFPRQVTERNEDDFADFREALVYTARQYLTATQTGVWPMGPIGACTAYGSCSYRGVCSVPRSMQKNLLSAKFKQQGGTNEASRI